MLKKIEFNRRIIKARLDRGSFVRDLVSIYFLTIPNMPKRNTHSSAIPVLITVVNSSSNVGFLIYMSNPPKITKKREPYTLFLVSLNSPSFL